MKAQWSNGGWYPGVIADARQRFGGAAEYFIEFDDGDSAWVGPEQVRVMGAVGKAASVAASNWRPEVGARVMADWTDDDWYPGTIAEGNSNGSMWFVQFDDGDTKWLPPSRLRPGEDEDDGYGAGKGAAPVVATNLQPGMRVSAEWTRGAWYDGTIAKANENSTKFFIQFDDGDTKWCGAQEIRVMPGQVPQQAPAWGQPQPAPQGQWPQWGTHAGPQQPQGMQVPGAPQGQPHTPSQPQPQWSPQAQGHTPSQPQPQWPPQATPSQPQQPQGMQQPAQPSAQPPFSPPVEKVIERQVLVVRCPYCKGLTPADVATCQTCGAKTH